MAGPMKVQGEWLFFRRVPLRQDPLQTGSLPALSTKLQGERRETPSTPVSGHTDSFVGQSRVLSLQVAGADQSHHTEPGVRREWHLPQGLNLRGISY